MLTMVDHHLFTGIIYVLSRSHLKRIKYTKKPKNTQPSSYFNSINKYLCNSGSATKWIIHARIHHSRVFQYATKQDRVHSERMDYVSSGGIFQDGNAKLSAGLDGPNSPTRRIQKIGRWEKIGCHKEIGTNWFRSNQSLFKQIHMITWD